MQIRPSLIAASLLAACASNKGPVGPQADPPVTDTGGEECVDDDDCGALEICEAETCRIGDRDNGFDEARPIYQNEPVAGVIAPPGDVDYYIYTSNGPEWLRIDTITDGDPANSLDTVVRVFAGNGAEHAVMDNFPTGRISTYDTVLYVFLPRADIWFVAVEDVSTWVSADEPRGGPGFTYELQLKPFGGATSEPDGPLEPSSTVALTTGTSIYAVGVRLEEDGDADWITVEHTLDGRPVDLFGHASIPGSPARARVRLHDADDTVLMQKDDLGDDGHASSFSLPAGTYRVEATDVLGRGGADHWYVLYVRTYEEGASQAFFGTPVYEHEQEPNDEAALTSPYTVVQATTSSGATYQVQYIEGRLDPEGDEDWFPVTTSGEHQVSVRCFAGDFGSLAELRVELWDGDLELTPPDQGVQQTAFWYYVYNVEVPLPGTTHVRIRARDEGASGLWGPGAYYRCQILQAEFDFIVQ